MRQSLLGIVATTAALLTSLAPAPASADPIPPGWQASGLKPVGYTDLGGRRGGIKLAIKHVGDRWILYKGGNGIEIIDVTRPEDPKFIKVVPGPKGTAASQITLHGNLLVLGLSRPITPEESSGRADGWTTMQAEAPADKPFEETVALYDISDPLNPKMVSKWASGAQGSHRNGYPGGRYAFLSTTVPGYRGFILLILDVSDPKNPKEAGRWAYPGSREGEKPGEITPSYHGPAFVSPDGKMLTLGYTPSVVNLDISDIRNPKLIGEVKLIPPMPNTLTQSIHTTVPLWDRKLIYFSGEPMKRNCTEPMSYVGFIDNADPSKPFLKSLFPTPLPPPGAPYKSFCDKAGRFGPHNTVTEIYNPDVMTPKDTMYVTWFSAGLRAFDISDPRDVRETGWFLPPDPPNPVAAQGGVLAGAATQEVLQDTRGYLYVIDSGWGIWVLRDEIKR
jgi:hypothetical protein